MISIYQNGIGNYEVVLDRQNGQIETLLITKDINQAVSLFNKNVISEQKATLMHWDGNNIINYTKDPLNPDVTPSPRAKIVNIPVLSPEELFTAVMASVEG